FLATFADSLGLAAFTFELWVNPGTVLPAWVGPVTPMRAAGFDRRSDGRFNGRVTVDLAGRPAFVCAPTSGGPENRVSGSKSILDGGWHHIVLTRTASGGAITLYVDGVSRGTTVGSPPITDMDTVTIGECVHPDIIG